MSLGSGCLSFGVDFFNEYRKYFERLKGRANNNMEIETKGLEGRSPE